MAQSILDNINKALRLPRPFLHESNPSLILIEEWPQLVVQIASQPIHIKPLGYYRTPDAVDMYDNI